MAVPIVNIMEPADWQDREMERLEAENARLRSCLTDAAENARLIMGENAKLRRDLEEANSQAEEVCIENAKLREEFDKMDVWHSKELLAAIDENKKLRELVNVFYHCTTSGYCDECPVNGGGMVHLMPDTICDTLHDRMRELGVEP